MKERLLRRRTVHRGRAVGFRVDTVRLPNGKTAFREYLDHPGAVAVVPVVSGPRENPRILFVRQYRHPVGQTTLEIPAGKLDPGESPARCLQRELEEETGYRAGRVKKLLSYWPTPAFANEIIHIFAAHNLRPGRFSPDEDEFVRPTVLPLKAALARIRAGVIKDSKTIIGLLAYSARR